MIKPETVSVKKGDAFGININVNKGSDLFGADFELQFDSRILNAFDAKPDDAMYNEVVFLSVPSEGKINIAISKKKGTLPFPASFRLVIIVFKSLAMLLRKVVQGMPCHYYMRNPKYHF